MVASMVLERRRYFMYAGMASAAMMPRMTTITMSSIMLKPRELRIAVLYYNRPHEAPSPTGPLLLVGLQRAAQHRLQFIRVGAAQRRQRAHRSAAHERARSGAPARARRSLVDRAHQLVPRARLGRAGLQVRRQDRRAVGRARR